MKKKFYLICIVLLLISGCKNYLISSYTVVFPAVPEAWEALLGEPHWKVEYLDSSGTRQKQDIKPGEKLKISLPATWANPVTAWPTWPEYNLTPELFKPAGGLFPHDISSNQINLAWETGHETVFYWELAFANSDNELKIPANFDWLRFRGLFTAGELNNEVCKDPWLVDWRSVAEKTIASNFDRRRLVPETAVSILIPAGHGRWHGASPFAEPLIFEENETPAFPVRSGVNVWISERGILRISGNTWVIIPLAETPRRKEE